jgi:hypothetical protein
MLKNTTRHSKRDRQAKNVLFAWLTPPPVAQNPLDFVVLTFKETLVGRREQGTQFPYLVIKNFA